MAQVRHLPEKDRCRSSRYLELVSVIEILCSTRDRCRGRGASASERHRTRLDLHRVRYLADGCRLDHRQRVVGALGPHIDVYASATRSSILRCACVDNQRERLAVVRSQADTYKHEAVDIIEAIQVRSIDLEGTPSHRCGDQCRQHHHRHAQRRGAPRHMVLWCRASEAAKRMRSLFLLLPIPTTTDIIVALLVRGMSCFI